MRKIVAVWAHFLASMDNILGEVDPNYRDSQARFTRRMALYPVVRCALGRFNAAVDATGAGNAESRIDIGVSDFRALAASACAEVESTGAGKAGFSERSELGRERDPLGWHPGHAARGWLLVAPVSRTRMTASGLFAPSTVSQM